jgi:hypothetical protein
MGGGVAIVDVNRDGLEDLFFVNGAALRDPMPAGAMPDKTQERYWNRLYINRGSNVFGDATAKWGLAGVEYGMGVATGDFDSDGRQDLYVTGIGRNRLYRNTGTRFEDITDKAGVAAGGWSSGAAFFDYDLDGKPDLFVARYLDWSFESSRPCVEGTIRSYCHPREFKAVTHLLFRNQGDGTFKDVSAQAGFARCPGKALGVRVDDVNDDGWPDLLVANDSAPQQLFVNRAGQRFEESAVRSGFAYDEDGGTYAGMGIDTGDVDRDGRVDVIVNALARQSYWLYRGKGGGRFEPASASSGIAAITEMHSGWGMRLADFDNDGWLDLAIAQGHVMDTIEATDPALRHREPMLIAKNLFGKFTELPSFGKPHAGRGLAVGDLDDDGRLDIVVSNNNEAPVLLRNTTDTIHNWLKVKFVARGEARVVVTTESGRRFRAYRGTSGSYLSASSPTLHFGLGDEKAATVEIIWGTGARSRMEGEFRNEVLYVYH